MRYREVERLLNENQAAEAGRVCETILFEKPGDLEATYLLCRVLVDTNKVGIAQILADYLTRAAPTKAQGWLVLGACETALARPEEALPPLLKALKLEPEWAEPYRCISAVYVMLNDLKNAEKFALKALEFGDHYIPRASLAFVELHRRNWRAGWDNYRHQLGRVKYRDYLDFGIPEWTGREPREELLIFAEQGLGDQIAYVSAIDKCKQLVCHPKLESLFKRSCDWEVYGEQFKVPITFDVTSKYQSAMSSAMRWQEVKPRGRWLKPHPDKKAQWKALMDEKGVKGRPWIGIAWTGGALGSSGWKDRNLKIEELAPILSLPFNFVSLEYKPHEPPPGVYRWPWATETNDYDDTAALVDNLAAVVTVPTTVYHLAGGLGIPAHVVVHKSPHFHEGQEGDSPWWESVKFYRRSQFSTEQCINQIADKLKELL